MAEKKTSAENLAEEILEENSEVDMEEVVTKVQAGRKALTRMELEIKQTKFLKKVREEEKVEVKIAPQYANEFGNNMHVTINGISVFVPVDGNTYKVPKTFAEEIERRLCKVNEKLNRIKGSKNANIFEEKSIGEVKLC